MDDDDENPNLDIQEFSGIPGVTIEEEEEFFDPPPERRGGPRPDFRNSGDPLDPYLGAGEKLKAVLREGHTESPMNDFVAPRKREETEVLTLTITLTLAQKKRRDRGDEA